MNREKTMVGTVLFLTERLAQHSSTSCNTPHILHNFVTERYYVSSYSAYLATCKSFTCNSVQRPSLLMPQISLRLVRQYCDTLSSFMRSGLQMKLSFSKNLVCLPFALYMIVAEYRVILRRLISHLFCALSNLMNN